MRLTQITEPELEFGTGRHIDIRFGIMHNGPLDFMRSSAPKNVRIGVVGDAEGVEGLLQWLERCKHGIDAKPSRQPNLFPRFPGFNVDVSFRSSILCDPSAQQVIGQRELDKLCALPDGRSSVLEAVEVFVDAFRHLTDSSTVDVCICAIPNRLLDAMSRADASVDTDELESAPSATRVDFHDLLKARTLSLKRPLQIVQPSTFDESKKRKAKNLKDRTRVLQDEATRAWNFHTALYYKAGGTPWRLVRDSSQLTTCFVGVSFFKTADGDRLETSVAQVFNERGEGVVVKGGAAKISKEDRQPHLESDGAERLLTDALTVYRREHHTLPARVVIHKSSKFNDAEREGFFRAVNELRVDILECVSISRSRTRLYRNGSYPPLRGTLLELDDKHHLLYTRGSVEFFQTYPGMYVPRPVLFRTEVSETTARQHAQEILELTKMNWNNTQFDGGDPITMRAARQVGDILKYTEDGAEVPSRYSFFM